MFVLAVDSSVIFQGVREKYGADISPQKARSFFDKIIQVPFKMPVDIYDMKNYVKNALNNLDIKTKTDEELETLTNIIKLSIGNNPRSMKRLFNSYNLLESVINSIGKGELNNQSKQIMFSILCMQNRFENMYKYLVLNQDIIDDGLFDRLIDTNSEFYTNEENLEDSEKSLFVDFFNEILALIDTNKNGEVDNEEIELFKKALEYSSITSTSTTPNEIKTTNISNNLKNICTRLASQLNERYLCKFRQTYRKGDREGSMIAMTRAEATTASNGRGAIRPTMQMDFSPKNGKISVNIRFFHKQPMLVVLANHMKHGCLI